MLSSCSGALAISTDSAEAFNSPISAEGLMMREFSLNLSCSAGLARDPIHLGRS